MITDPGTATSSQKPSSQRPIPLRARTDLTVSRIEFKGEGSYVVKDPVALKYHRLRPEQYYLLRRLDDERTLEQLRDDLRREFPTLTLRLTDVQNLVTDLHKKNLARGSRVNQADGLLNTHREERRKKFWQTLRNLLYVRLPGFDPEAILSFLYPFVRWCFRPWAVAFFVVFVVSSWTLLTVKFGEFSRELPTFDQFFAWPNLLYVWLLIGGAKVLHELGHGMFCKHFGGECHEIGVMLLVFSPCMYCDVSDSWLLKSKWQRMMIGAAGMWVEVVLSGAAIYTWALADTDFVRALAVNLFFVTSVTTVIFNANPLLRFDGYYILSDFLEIPNLRQKADRLLSDTWGHWCLGIKPKPDPFLPDRGKEWFILYALSAAFYRWFILFVITLFLYSWLKPYGLQSIGATLAVASVAGILFNLGKNVHQKVTAPRRERLSKPRMIVSSLLAAGVFAGVMMIPVPFHIEAPFLTDPAVGDSVYVVEAGRLDAVEVEPGERVTAGQVLARLGSDDLPVERLDLTARIDVQRARLAAARATGDEAGEVLAREQMDHLGEQLTELDARVDALTLTAPRDGIVLPPPRRPGDGSEDRLPGWTGSPLDPENVGAFLAAGTEFAVVSPDGRQRATLFVDQADRNDVFTGTPVELKLEHRPAAVYESAVAVFARRDLDEVPGALSNKYGGALPTVTDPRGREQLTSVVYQATVPIPESAGPLRPGQRGTARFDQPDRTLGRVAVAQRAADVPLQAVTLVSPAGGSAPVGRG